MRSRRENGEKKATQPGSGGKRLICWVGWMLPRVFAIAVAASRFEAVVFDYQTRRFNQGIYEVSITPSYSPYWHHDSSCQRQTHIVEQIYICTTSCLIKNLVVSRIAMRCQDSVLTMDSKGSEDLSLPKGKKRPCYNTISNRI